MVQPAEQNGDLRGQRGWSRESAPEKPEGLSFLKKSERNEQKREDSLVRDNSWRKLRATDRFFKKLVLKRQRESNNVSCEMIEEVGTDPILLRSPCRSCYDPKP